MMEIIQLDSSFKGKKLLFSYESTFYYLARPIAEEGSFGVTFKKCAFSELVHKEFIGTLLNDWLEDPLLFGVKNGADIIGYLELSHEKWNNRLRISHFIIDAMYRRHGLGRMLMEKAISEAERLKVRALVLETQSCNGPAIAFYLNCGFVFTGCDMTAYSNSDVRKDEVRLELVRIVE